MIECLDCGLTTGEDVWGEAPDMKCPNCGSRKLDNDEYLRGFINE